MSFNLFCKSILSGLVIVKTITKNAKIYARNKKISLLRLIENYLQALTVDENKSEFEISPFVKSISTGKSLPNDLDYKNEYSDFLGERHPYYEPIAKIATLSDKNKLKMLVSPISFTTVYILLINSFALSNVYEPATSFLSKIIK